MKKRFLYVDDAREFLNAVQQNISLFDGGLILVIFRIGAVRFDNTTDFIDAAMKATSSNETCQLPEKFQKFQIDRKIQKYLK